jgi:large subunit ribosomal protein L11
MQNQFKCIKLHILGGKASPSSSIGPSLGQHGINIVKFCKEFNDKTQDKKGLILPTTIKVYPNKTFSFTCKEPPTSILIKKILGLSLNSKPGSGASKPGLNNIASIHMTDIFKIVELKKKDLNSYDKIAASKIIIGTAKSMGISILDKKE